MDNLPSQIADQARKILGAHAALLLLLDGEELVFQGWAGLEEAVTRAGRLKVSESLTGAVIREGRPLVCPDLSKDPAWRETPLVRQFGYQAMLAVPLTIENRLVGVLKLLHRESRPFPSGEVELLGALATQAALAVENARLYGKSERRRREAETLLEVADERGQRLATLSALTRLMTSARGSRKVFHAVAEAATTLLGADMARVWVDDPVNHVLQVQGSFGVDIGFERRATEHPSIRYGWGMVGRVFESRTPEYVLDIQQDSRWLNERLAKEADLHAFAGIPLITGDRVVGVLAILYGDQRQFAPEEKELMRLLADQAAIAIENARLVEDLQGALEELKAAQEKLVRGATMRALGELASGTAHHLNNLLAIVLGRVRLLQSSKKGALIRRPLEIIERAGMDAAEVVRRVARFARMQPIEERQPLDLKQLAGEVLEMTRGRWQDAAQAQGIRIDAALEGEDVPAVTGNAAALREVLINLVLNAVDALPSGGRIVLRTFREDGWVGLAVTDTGVGMSPQVRARALEPFFTTKGPKSVGLGLSLTYGILQRHGGELRIDSVAGEGTTVTIRLPVAPEAVDGVPRPVAPPAPVDGRLVAGGQERQGQ